MTPLNYKCFFTVVNYAAINPLIPVGFFSKFLPIFKSHKDLSIFFFFFFVLCILVNSWALIPIKQLSINSEKVAQRNIKNKILKKCKKIQFSIFFLLLLLTTVSKLFKSYFIGIADITLSKPVAREKNRLFFLQLESLQNFLSFWVSE